MTRQNDRVLVFPIFSLYLGGIEYPRLTINEHVVAIFRLTRHNRHNCSLYFRIRLQKDNLARLKPGCLCSFPRSWLLFVCRGFGNKGQAAFEQRCFYRANFLNKSLFGLNHRGEPLQRIQVSVYILQREPLRARMSPSVPDGLHLFNKMASLRGQIHLH